MRKVRRLLVLLGGALTLFTQPIQGKSPADMLVVAQNIDDIVSLDPAQGYELTSFEVLFNVYDRLIETDHQDPARVDPALADSWTVSPDGKTLTFHLRADARFASGDPVRPEDVVFSFQRVLRLNKAPAMILAELGWTADNIAQAVRAVSDHDVAVTLVADVSPSFALNILASYTCSIVDRTMVMANSRDNDFGNGWLSRHSAGSGSFSLRLWQPNEAVVMEANPSHFSGAAKMRQVIIADVTEPSTQRLMLQTGDADIAYDLSPDQIAAIRNDATIRVATYPQGILDFFSLNVKFEKLRNPALWQAMRYLVDYHGIADTLLLHSLKVHQSFWPSGFPGSVDDTPYSLDIARARKILLDGNVPPGLTIDMDVIAASPFLEIAQSIQRTMGEAGITVNLLPGTAAQVITKYRARAHEMILLYWNPDFMDPDSNAQSFAFNSDNGDDAPASTTAWRNSWLIPDLSRETEQALTERDPEKRLELYRDLQRKVMEQAPWVTMFQVQKQVALRREVEGFYHGPLAGMLLFDRITKEAGDRR